MSLAVAVETVALLGDESRLRLCALLRERELTVSDLVRVTGIAQPRVSTHLARLRQGGVVRDRRDGPHAFYALVEAELGPAARAVLDEATGDGDATLAADKKRLAALEAERTGRLPDAFAGEMDRHYSPGRTWPALAAGLAALVELGDVLDVGSGDGAVAAMIAPGCRSITCVDASPKMVAAANARFAALAPHGGDAGARPRARALEADAHGLPLDDASFDAALVFHTLTYAERPRDVLAECARVLRPGGKLVVLSLDAHEHAAVTAPYGERHPGFSPRALRGLVERAGLVVARSSVAFREPKKPHFEVVLAVAHKPGPGPRRVRGRPARPG